MRQITQLSGYAGHPFISVIFYVQLQDNYHKSNTFWG